METKAQEERRKVQVWVYAKRPQGRVEVLLLLTRPERGGFWQPVTGGVENGESLADAADREASEETGLAFKTPPFPLGRDFRFEKNDVAFREHGFAVEAKDKSDPVLDPMEHVKFEWVEISQAFRMLRHKSNAEMLEVLVKLLARFPGAV